MESNIYIIANFNFGSRAAPANQVESFNTKIIKRFGFIPAILNQLKKFDCK